MNEQEREAFEAWHRQDLLDMPVHQDPKERQFRTWQARAALAAKAPTPLPNLPRYTPSNIDGTMDRNPDGSWIHEDDLAEALAAKVPAECERLRELYEELLFSVGKKHPYETRHQTALRYIRQAEATGIGDSGEK